MSLGDIIMLIGVAMIIMGLSGCSLVTGKGSMEYYKLDYEDGTASRWIQCSQVLGKCYFEARE